jgi:hypothetical protein
LAEAPLINAEILFRQAAPVQTLLSVLINLHIAGYDDRDKAREEIISAAEEIVDKAAIPDLPVAEQKQARDQAKFVLGVLINEGDVH